MTLRGTMLTAVGHDEAAERATMTEALVKLSSVMKRTRTLRAPPAARWKEANMIGEYVRADSERG